MANVNITGQQSFAGNSFTVPTNGTAVTFHSANAAVTICFSNYATFNTSSFDVPSGGQPSSLTIQNRQNTNFSINPSGTNCAGSPTADTTYTIDMSSGTDTANPGHHGHHKH